MIFVISYCLRSHTKNEIKMIEAIKNKTTRSVFLCMCPIQLVETRFSMADIIYKYRLAAYSDFIIANRDRGMKIQCITRWNLKKITVMFVFFLSCLISHNVTAKADIVLKLTSTGILFINQTKQFYLKDLLAQFWVKWSCKSDKKKIKWLLKFFSFWRFVKNISYIILFIIIYT